MKSKWESEKENLQQLILVDKLSYEEIGRRYGCTGSNIKKVALRLGILLEKRRSINESETFNRGLIKTEVHKCINCGKEFKHIRGASNKYCCNKCFNEFKVKKHLLEWKNGLYYINPNSGIPNFIREYLFQKVNNKCEKCGFDGINPFSKKSVLQVHHIDGDASNNAENNLQVLCPNCHSMTENYMNLNRGKSARNTRYKTI